MTILGALRRHGLVKTIQLVSYRLVQRLNVLDVTQLMILDVADAVAPADQDDLEFRFLTPDEVRSLSQEGTHGLEASLPDRISNRGDLCFAAFAKSKLAGYAWFAFDQVVPECNRGESLLTGVGISFPESMAFMYKGFVHREFRGERIYGRLMSHALTLLASRKTTHLLSTADWINFSAQRSCYRIGYRYLGLIWRFGGLSRMFTVLPKLPDPMGIRFANAPSDATPFSTVENNVGSVSQP